mgnify:CR=1 FL=1
MMLPEAWVVIVSELPDDDDEAAAMLLSAAARATGDGVTLARECQTCAARTQQGIPGVAACCAESY